MFPPLISLTAELIKAPRADFLLGRRPRSLAPTPLLLPPSVRSSGLLRLRGSKPLPVFSAVGRWCWGRFWGSPEGHVTRHVTHLEGGRGRSQLAVGAAAKIALRFSPADLAGPWGWWGGPDWPPNTQSPALLILASIALEQMAPRPPPLSSPHR